jgi:hypothetical protein
VQLKDGLIAQMKGGRLLMIDAIKRLDIVSVLTSPYNWNARSPYRYKTNFSQQLCTQIAHGFLIYLRKNVDNQFAANYIAGDL